MTLFGSFFCLVVISTTVSAKPGFGNTDQEWGFVKVRDGAEIFWWLYYTTAMVPKPTDRPLVIWLQGGPGGSSSGYGNFGEIGPLDVNLQPNNNTWVKDLNVLFVDNPVGTGFSYAEDGCYCRNNEQIAQDFLKFMLIFYEELPAFKTVPLYIFSESYGGKMSIDIALVLDKAQKEGKIECNFKGIGLGDAWISPADSILTWAPYLLNLGIVDQNGYEAIMDVAVKAAKAVEDGDYSEAAKYFNQTESVIGIKTNGVSFYNVLTRSLNFCQVMTNGCPLSKPGLSPYDKYLIGELMNDQVKVELNISRNWAQVNKVFANLKEDFMKPVVSNVEFLLNNTDIEVVVYNGQLDLIVDTPGTIKWVDNLNWKLKDEWKIAPRTGFSVNMFYEGYVKKVGHLTFYWVDRSGHMVPSDNPDAMYYILKTTTNNFTG